MSEKTLEQLQRGHRLGHKGGSDEFFGVMFRWIEQQQFHIEYPENLIGRIDVNRDSAMSFLLQACDRIFVSQIIWEHETIHARRHTILGCFIAELEDFLDHFRFAFIQGALFFTHFNQRLQFLIAHACTGAQVSRREKIDNISADRLEFKTYAVLLQYRYYQGSRS